LDISPPNRLTVFPPPELLAHLEASYLGPVWQPTHTSVAVWSHYSSVIGNSKFGRDAIIELGDLPLVLAAHSPQLRHLWIYNATICKAAIGDWLLSNTSPAIGFAIRKNTFDVPFGKVIIADMVGVSRGGRVTPDVWGRQQHYKH
jgi:hypothetical protein